MQRFVKYCKKEHNIQLDCKTIQIGTLHYYRDMDPDFAIADPNEGEETVLIGNYDSAEASPEAKTLLNQDRFCDDTSRVVINNSVIRNSFPNSLIFCVSQDPGKNYPEEAHRYKNDYDSYYLIGNINSFVEKLANIIVENFKTNWFHEDFRPQLDQFTVSDYKRLGLQWQHKEITYVEKTTIIQESKVFQKQINQDPFERIVFTKDKKFRKDKEYRFMFAFVHPHIPHIIPVRKEPIILPTSPLTTDLIS